MTSSYSNVIASICNKISGETITAEWLEDNGNCMLGNRYSVSYCAMQKEAFFSDNLTDTTLLCRGMTEHGFVAVVEVVQRKENAFYCTSIVKLGDETFIDISCSYEGETTELCGQPLKSYRVLPFGGYSFLIPSEK